LIGFPIYKYSILKDKLLDAELKPPFIPPEKKMMGEKDI